jgi:hypothetical protein
MSIKTANGKNFKSRLHFSKLPREMVYTDKLLTGTSFTEVTTGTLLLLPFALGSPKT